MFKTIKAQGFSIKENLDIDTVLKDFNGEMGEIRPLIEWFEEL